MTRTLFTAFALVSFFASQGFAQQPGGAPPPAKAPPAQAAPAKPATPPPAAAPAPAAAAPTEHSMVTPNEVKWGDAPPSLPAGAKMAVLYGDPGKPGLFILRAKFPANFKIPAHWHPTDEMVTVISGSVSMGMGDKLDPKAAKALPTGSSATMPAKTNHYLITKAPAVVQVTAMGPFEITYVNPDDDPRKGKAAEAPAAGAPAAAAAKK